MSLTDDDKQWIDGRLEVLETKLLTAFHHGRKESKMTDEDLNQIRAIVRELENHLIEKMRDMQTEILRGFKAHSEGPRGNH